jgi:hypothetical protein
MGLRKRNKERGGTRSTATTLAPLAQLPQLNSLSSAGHYEPQRETQEMLRVPTRLLPLQRAGGLHGLDRPTPKPQKPPETLVRRAATTTPTGTASPDSEVAEYRKQLVERDAKITALEKHVKVLEMQKASPEAAAAAEIAALNSRLQASIEGFMAAEKVIKEQEVLITSLQEQLGRAPGVAGLGRPPQGQGSPATRLAPLGDGATKPKSAKEIAAAHSAQRDLLWIDPWVRKGERLDGVRGMCTDGVRQQLVEVAQQGDQALETGLVNLKESLEAVEDESDSETLGFFKEFTQEVLKRQQTNLRHS